MIFLNVKLSIHHYNIIKKGTKKDRAIIFNAFLLSISTFRAVLGSIKHYCVQELKFEIYSEN